MYGMKPPEIATEQTRSILGVTEGLCAIDEIDVGVETRTVITRLRN